MTGGADSLAQVGAVGGDGADFGEHWYRAALRSWRAGSGALPTTRAGAEIAALITMVGWRVGTLAQIVPAVPDGLLRSTRPGLDVALLIVVLVESVAICTAVIRRRAYVSAGWASVDTSMALLVLLAEPAYVGVGDRVGTWTAWAPALAINVTVGAALGCPKRWQLITMTSLLAGAYLLVSAPAIGHGARGATVASNVLSFFVFAVLARAMSGFVRRFGADADTARAAAVEAARQMELERHRRLLHDPASLLRYLADPDLDPVVASAVREQALAEANRIRAFLADSRSVDDGRPLSGLRGVGLVEVVRSSARGFTDLPVELVLDLADGVELAPPAAQAVAAATATVLHNVRRHAGPGASVVVHADAHQNEREWEVTIRDDGRGFDPTSTPRGYGLSHLADAALAEHDISSHVHSAPGVGTTVTLRGGILS